MNRTTASNLLEAVDSTVNCGLHCFLEKLMESETPKGAKASDHIGWVNAQFRSLTEFDVLLIKEFLIGTPAIGLSKQSSGFISRFSVNETADAEVLLDEICQGLDVYWHESAEQLKESLINSDRLGDIFWKRGEFASMVTSSTVTRAIKPMLEAIEKNKTARTEQKTRLVRSKYEKADTFFRHIRNAIAHGSFRRIGNGSSALYAFQDENRDGFISARMVISEKHLRDIITSMREFEKNGI